MYGLWQALVRIPIGIASDWLGMRKWFMIGGLALSAVGALIMAASNDAAGLAIGRAVTGVSAGAWVVIVVAFSALFPPEEAVSREFAADGFQLIRSHRRDVRCRIADGPGWIHASIHDRSSFWVFFRL